MGGLRVFVSYAREDRAVVEQVAADLRHLGHEVWFDEHLLGGTDWWREILRRIRGAHVLLFAISPSSVASVPCLTELGYADRTSRRLLPVMVQWTSPAVLPDVLAHAQFVAYATEGWQGLASALRAMPPPPPLPDPLPADPVLPEPPLARLRRRVMSAEPMTPGGQHELLDELIHESRRPGQWGGSYDLLVSLNTRLDLYADVARRCQPALEEVWRRGPADERAGRPSPWADVAPWSWWFVVAMGAAGIVTLGIVPGVLWWRNRAIPSRRTQVRVMIVVAVAVFAVFLLIGALTPPEGDVGAVVGVRSAG